jgi:hypothetical protein
MITQYEAKLIPNDYKAKLISPAYRVKLPIDIVVPPSNVFPFTFPFNLS